MIDLYKWEGNRLAKTYSASAAKPFLQIIDSSILNHSVDPLVEEWIHRSDCPENIRKGIIKMAQLFSSVESRKETAKKLLVDIMQSGKYGYLSAHRIGTAVDISGQYIYREQLKDYISTNYNNSLKLSDTYADNHLHIGNK